MTCVALTVCLARHVLLVGEKVWMGSRVVSKYGKAHTAALKYTTLSVFIDTSMIENGR